MHPEDRDFWFAQGVSEEEAEETERLFRAAYPERARQKDEALAQFDTLYAEMEGILAHRRAWCKEQAGWDDNQLAAAILRDRNADELDVRWARSTLVM